MSFIKKLFGNNKKQQLLQPIFTGKQQKGNSIFEVYKTEDAESAKAFLLNKEVVQERYYIVVDTPDGSWGKDKIGLYLERLRPWQTDTSLVQCKGVAHHPTITENAVSAARNVVDNYVTKIVCGNCNREWLDGVRYQNITVVRCPNCKKYNKVSTENYFVLTENQPTNPIFRESTSPNYKSIALLFYDDENQAKSDFAKISEACNKLSGLTQNLIGTSFEYYIAPTSVKVIAIRAIDDKKRNHALELSSALSVFGDSSPQGSQQNIPNSYTELNELINKCALVQIARFDELPKAKPNKCVACNGTTQLQYKSPHTGFKVYHHCQFCDEINSYKPLQ